MIREACARQGIDAVEAIGHGVGRTEAAPESLLPQFDLVFAKARCALEALSVGCAVVVTDVSGLAGLVTPETVAAWRRLNFGVRTLQTSPVTVETLARAIAEYDARASATVTEWIRREASSAHVLDALEACYDDAVQAGSPWSADTAADFTAAASSYLAGLSPYVTEREALPHVERERDAARLEAATERQARVAMEQSATWRLLAPYRRLRAWLRR
jgi:hypothetical protein